MLLSSTSGQHVGEASAYTDTGVVRDAAVMAEPLPNETAPLCGVALTHRRPEPGRDATGRCSRRETSTDVGVGPVGERTCRRRARASCPRRGLDVTEVKASPDGERRAGVSRTMLPTRAMNATLINSFFIVTFPSSVFATARAGAGDAAV